MSRVLLTCALVLLALPAVAQNTYYIDDALSPGCSDTGGQAGSEAAPWCTLSYAETRISGGDTVFIKNGNDMIYNEASSVVIGDEVSGTSGAPTIFQAFAGATPIIQGPDSGLFRIGDGLGLEAVWMEFRDFEINGFNQNWYCFGCTDVLLNNMDISDCNQECVRLRYSTRVTLTNNVVHDAGTGGGNGECFYVGGTSGPPNDQTNAITIQNNDIYNCGHEGIDVRRGTRGIHILDNTIHEFLSTNTSQTAAIIIQACDGSGLSCGVTSTRDIDVQRNTIYGYTSPVSVTNDSGIRCDGRCQIMNNIIYGIPANAIGIKSDSFGGDTNQREFWHNTINPGSGSAVTIVAGASGFTTSQNNISGATAGANLIYDSGYFTNAAANDYTLVMGAAPVDYVNALDLRASVPNDFVNNPRDATPDVGAYEFGAVPPPTADPNAGGGRLRRRVGMDELRWAFPTAVAEAVTRFGVSYDLAPFVSVGMTAHATLADVFTAVLPVMTVGLHSLRIRACNPESCGPPSALREIEVCDPLANAALGECLTVTPTPPPPLPTPSAVDAATIAIVN
jgi:hypothetical protein